jgi:hypothetical protein
MMTFKRESRHYELQIEIFKKKERLCYYSINLIKQWFIISHDERKYRIVRCENFVLFIMFVEVNIEKFLMNIYLTSDFVLFIFNFRFVFLFLISYSKKNNIEK